MEWLIFNQYINIHDGIPGSTVESVEVTREAVLGMSGPTFYYGQDKDTVEEKSDEDLQRATA